MFDVLSPRPISSQELCSWSYFYHSLLFISIATVALFRRYGHMCMYNHMCCPHVSSVRGELRLLSGMRVYEIGTHNTRAADTLWWSCVYLCMCVLDSLSTSEKMQFIIIFMKLWDFWAELKQSRIWLRWPSALWPGGKMTKKGTDEAQLEGVSMYVCGWDGGQCADESHSFCNCFRRYCIPTFTCNKV